MSSSIQIAWPDLSLSGGNSRLILHPKTPTQDKEMRQTDHNEASICSIENGFTLVELMIVVAILAILSSVAIPSYVNYMNRAKQTEAVMALMNAKMEQELFYEDNSFRYAGTIACLPSFASFATSICTKNCGSCLATTYRTSSGYKLSVQFASNNAFRVLAEKKLYTNSATDVISLSSDTGKPVVVNDSAIGFSIFKWLFQ